MTLLSANKNIYWERASESGQCQAAIPKNDPITQPSSPNQKGSIALKAVGFPMHRHCTMAWHLSNYPSIPHCVLSPPLEREREEWVVCQRVMSCAREMREEEPAGRAATLLGIAMNEWEHLLCWQVGCTSKSHGIPKHSECRRQAATHTAANSIPCFMNFCSLWIPSTRTVQMGRPVWPDPGPVKPGPPSMVRKSGRAV